MFDEMGRLEERVDEMEREGLDYFAKMVKDAVSLKNLKQKYAKQLTNFKKHLDIGELVDFDEYVNSACIRVIELKHDLKVGVSTNYVWGEAGLLEWAGRTRNRSTVHGPILHPIRLRRPSQRIGRPSRDSS